MLLAGIRCTPSLVTPTTARAFAAVRELWATQLRVKDTGKVWEMRCGLWGPSPLCCCCRARRLLPLPFPVAPLGCSPLKLCTVGSSTYAPPQQTFEVEFNTGERFSLPAEYLRVESPAAGNQDARDAFGRPKASPAQRRPSASA